MGPAWKLLASNLVKLVPALPEEPDVLGQPRLDLLVEQELGEDGGELLPQKLVGEVDGGVHDASAVRPESKVGQLMGRSNKLPCNSHNSRRSLVRIQSPWTIIKQTVKKTKMEKKRLIVVLWLVCSKASIVFSDMSLNGRNQRIGKSLIKYLMKT